MTWLCSVCMHHGPCKDLLQAHSLSTNALFICMHSITFSFWSRSPPAFSSIHLDISQGIKIASPTVARGRQQNRVGAQAETELCCMPRSGKLMGRQGWVLISSWHFLLPGRPLAPLRVENLARPGEEDILRAGQGVVQPADGQSRGCSIVVHQARLHILRACSRAVAAHLHNQARCQQHSHRTAGYDSSPRGPQQVLRMRDTLPINLEC